MKVRTAVREDAIELCKVVRMSIEKLCVADHQGDKAILDQWLANKTPETVARWFTNPDNINLVAVDDSDVILAAGRVRRDPNCSCVRSLEAGQSRPAKCANQPK